MTSSSVPRVSRPKTKRRRASIKTRECPAPTSPTSLPPTSTAPTSPAPTSPTCSSAAPTSAAPTSPAPTSRAPSSTTPTSPPPTSRVLASVGRSCPTDRTTTAAAHRRNGGDRLINGCTIRPLTKYPGANLAGVDLHGAHPKPRQPRLPLRRRRGHPTTASASGGRRSGAADGARNLPTIVAAGVSGEQDCVRARTFRRITSTRATLGGVSPRNRVPLPIELHPYQRRVDAERSWAGARVEIEATRDRLVVLVNGRAPIVPSAEELDPGPPASLGDFAPNARAGRELRSATRRRRRPDRGQAEFSAAVRFAGRASQGAPTKARDPPMAEWGGLTICQNLR